jgi:hypothetical protein
MDYYKPKAAIRTSLARYGRSGNLLDIPLYLIGRFPAILAGCYSSFAAAAANS